jgi:CDGSH-type Zn-finger protein
VNPGSARVGRIPTITIIADGPLLVRGAVRIQDADGTDVPVRRRVVAICRCGRSSIQPFCDDTHKVVPFSPRAVSGTVGGAFSAAWRPAG